MSFIELAVAVIGNFFFGGMVAGFLIVAVLPRHGGRRYVDGGDWRPLPPPRDDDHQPTRWPGD